MPNIFQIRTVHSGFTGAPGYTQTYFDASGSTLGAQAASDAMHTFWETFAASMAGDWHYSLEADVETLNDSTGALVGVTSTVPLAQSTFGTAGAYSAGVGAVTKWVTGAVHGTRRLTGRTFIVPLGGGSYDSTGTLASSALSQIRSAATALVAQQDFGVWGRPVGGVNGLFSNALASNVRDHVAWLSSRRD